MILLPIFLITFISAKSYHSVLMSTITSRANQTLELVSNSVDSEADRMMKTSDAIVNDREVVSNLSLIHTNENNLQDETYRQRLDRQLANYFHYTSDLSSAIFFFKNQGVYCYNQTMELNESDIRGMPWYRQALHRQHTVRFFGVQDHVPPMEVGKPKITVAVSPGNSLMSEEVELILFVFEADSLQKHLRSQVSKSGELFVFDESGSIIVSGHDDPPFSTIADYPYLTEAVKEPAGYFVTNISGESSFVVYLTSSKGWKYVRTIPYERFVRKVNEVNRQTFLVASVGIFFSLLVSIFLVRSLVKPILSLVKQMNRVKDGQFEAKIKVQTACNRAQRLLELRLCPKGIFAGGERLYHQGGFRGSACCPADPKSGCHTKRNHPRVRTTAQGIEAAE
jgi:two-component system sensor histidine kinase YesM